jgi:hypothetical protein
MPMEFRFDGPRRTFTCSLEPRRCKHINPTTQRQCSRVQYIGSGICWQHLMCVHHLKVAATTIPQATGKGLFAYSRQPGAAVLFRRGDKIIEYAAEMIGGPAALLARYGPHTTAPYAVAHRDRTFENGACVRGPGTMANTYPGHNNATFVVPGGGRTAWLKATRTIRSGEEIALSYGTAYALAQPGVTHSTRRTRGPYRAYRVATVKP